MNNVQCPVIETKRNKMNCEKCKATSHLSLTPGYRGKLVAYSMAVDLDNQKFTSCPYNSENGGSLKGGEHDSNS